MGEKKAQSKNEHFAVVEMGGKQYQVFEGGQIAIERLADKKEGDTVVFDKVLLIDNGKDTLIGDPYLEGAQVEATFMHEEQGKKIEVLRFKSKSRYLKRGGHRQPHSHVEVKTIKS